MEWRLPMLLLGVLACAPAMAAQPGSSSTEFEFQYPEHGDLGAGFRSEVLLGKRLVLDAAADAREHRGGGVGMASLGLGMRLQQTGPLAVVLGLSADAVVGEFGPDDEPEGMSGVASGAGANAEVSYRFNDKFELLARLKVTTMDTCPVVGTIGARFYPWKRLALAVDVQEDDFGARFGLGLRLDLSRL